VGNDLANRDSLRIFSIWKAVKLLFRLVGFLVYEVPVNVCWAAFVQVIDPLLLLSVVLLYAINPVCELNGFWAMLRRGGFDVHVVALSSEHLVWKEVLLFLRSVKEMRLRPLVAVLIQSGVCWLLLRNLRWLLGCR
jgi:hypothetical protein